MRKMVLFFITTATVIAGCKSTSKTAAAAANVMQQPDASLQETYWKLTELMGNPLTSFKGTREPHIILKKENNRLNAFAGCNALSGSYILEEGNRIRFSGVASTRMACPDMTIEDGVKRVLETTDNYSIKGDSLSLNKAKMAPLARFEAVYMK